MMNKDMVAYYRERAEEYEKKYIKPERQDDLVSATVRLQEIFAGKEVL